MLKFLDLGLVPQPPPTNYVGLYCNAGVLYWIDEFGTTTSIASGTGDLKADGSIPLTANWDAGSFKITAEQFESDVATGTPPLVVASSTQVDNLVAEFASKGLSITQPCRNETGGVLAAGAVVYISGFDVGNDLIEVTEADASSAATMPAIGVILDDIANNDNGYVVVAGVIEGLDTSAFGSGDALYVSEAAGELTATKPQGTALIQKMGLCIRSHVNLGSVGVVGAGRSNDVPNLPENYVWLGDSNGVAQAVAVASILAGGVTYKGGYDADTNTPDLDTAPSGVLTGDMYTVSVAGTFFTAAVNVGDVLIAEVDSASAEADWTIVEHNIDYSAAQIKALYESNADTNEFSDAEQSLLAAIATAIIDADYSGAEGLQRKTGAGAYEVIKTNLNASVAPTVTDDSSAGYAVYSPWVDTVADQLYFCLDATVGAAVWQEVGAGGGGGMTVTPVKTAAYTASANEVVPVDSSGGAFDITLPATPGAQERIIVIDVGRYCGTYPVGVLRNGKNLLGLAEDHTLDQDGARIDVAYDGTDNWDGHLIGHTASAPGTWVELGSDTIEGSAGSTLTVSGLDLAAYKMLKVVAKLKNATGTNASISLFYNGDTTPSNYNRQIIVGNNTGITGTRTNTALVAALRANLNTNIHLEIMPDVDGYPCAVTMNPTTIGSGLELMLYAHHRNSTDNVNSITLSSDVASSFAIGCTVTVFGIPNDASGVVAPAQYCRVETTASPSIPNGSGTDIPWDAASGSRAAWWDSGDPTKITVDADGDYEVSGCFEVASGGTPTDAYAAIWLNNTTRVAFSRWQANSPPAGGVSRIVNLSAGDYLTFRVAQTTGAARTIVDAATSFSVKRVL